jgi:XTP/dITP diphosphohydrolase
MTTDLVIVLATTNQGKLAELRTMLQPREVSVRGLDDFADIPPAPEDGATFADNARQKARHYSQLLNRLVLADDSGLQVAALDGAPGIYSARFAILDTTDRAEQDRANNQKLLRLLADVPLKNRQARFCCCLCLHSPNDVILEVQGNLEGMILDHPQGSNGFGYDPIFYIPDKQKTVAQLTPEEKNALSHRGQALRKLLLQWNKVLEILSATKGKNT